MHVLYGQALLLMNIWPVETPLHMGCIGLHTRVKLSQLLLDHTVGCVKGSALLAGLHVDLCPPNGRQHCSMRPRCKMGR